MDITMKMGLFSTETLKGGRNRLVYTGLLVHPGGHCWIILHVHKCRSLSTISLASSSDCHHHSPIYIHATFPKDYIFHRFLIISQVCNHHLNKPNTFTSTNLAGKSPALLPPFLLKSALMIFNHLRVCSNILQHISDCGSPSNVKSLYCFCFCNWVCRLRNTSINLYLYVNPVEWKSSWGFGKKEGLLQVLYSIMTSA